MSKTKQSAAPQKTIRNVPGLTGSVVYPTAQAVESFAPVNVKQASRLEALEPEESGVVEIKAIHEPKGPPQSHSGVPISVSNEEPSLMAGEAEAPVASATGTSPGATKSFKGEYETGGNIPPDTHGAVGTTHVVTVSNERMSIQTRDGVSLSRVTMTSFWTGTTVKGAAVTSAFDTKVFFDRFNNRFILVSSLGGAVQNSGAGLAVSQTADPTGLWNRYTVVSDPTSTATAGHGIDYPSVGFNKNWIVIDENTFNFTSTGFSTYYGQQMFVFDKQAAYSNTLSSVSQFEGTDAACTASATQQSELGCGFTMAPSIVEDNTTDTVYFAEDWNSTSGQLRLSKLTGTPSTPVLTVGTQFPQSTNSWKFNAARILQGATQTGGYVPQRQQQANLPSGTRIMANDSRIQNTVLRNGSLWATHTVMVAATPTAAGVAVGGAANPDIRSAVQWWQIDPTIENAAAGTPALQRARIEDPTADNCHNGSGGTRTVGTCVSTGTQVGEFFAFPNISVNQNNDALIGFTKFSALTYPNAGYAIRTSADPINTTRDQAIFRPGQANYNIGGGSGSTRQNRWGDYSAAQTDPLNDTSFWTVQEYAGEQRDFGLGAIAGNWDTWWAQVDPAATAPSKTGNLIISEFRLRGPQGVRDEYVELYNPSDTPIVVNTADNSEGWAIANSNTGAAITNIFSVIPNGTVIPARGHFLVTDNPESTTGPTLTYSLTNYPSVQPTVVTHSVRGADSDTGWSIDLADNSGIAIFKTATTANMTAATRMDSAGFTSTAVGLFKEGNGIPAITATTPTGQIAFVRNLVSGTPQDTNANENDFIFVDTALETLGAQPKLGAPAPENLNSPIQRFFQFPIDNVDRSKPNTADPNRVRNASSYTDTLTPTTEAGGVYPLGTLSIRKVVGNGTGVPVTRLRFRITDITSFPQPVGTADLRALTSPTISVTSNDAGWCAPAAAPCSMTVQGLTLEQPPTQGSGGALNSTLSAGTITFATPLPPGGAINVNFLLGVRQSGGFRFLVTVEALP